MRRILSIGVLAAALVAQLSGCAVPRSGGGTVSDKALVVALVDTADAERQAGRLERAAAVLERALRIEPRNAVIWHRLAQIRLEQNEFRQASSLAAKSNALASGDARLRAANWRLIGKARARRGDVEGAQAAFARAARLNRR